jgi:hypothetical protein
MQRRKIMNYQTIVIFPERYHHVSIIGKVRFRVEFYDVGGLDIADNLTKQGERPGEDFMG